MKKPILFIVLTMIMGSASAQISLEKAYTSSTALTELSISGYKYFLMDVVNNKCQLYNMDHSLWKTINIAVPTGMYLYDIRYVSESLFNSDSKVELAYTYYSYDTTLLYYTYYTRVINQDGAELLSIPGCAYVEVEVPGTYGTKMLAYVYDYSIINWTLNTLVYSLPGSLPLGALPVEGSRDIKKPFPNPASSVVTIPYELPSGVNEAELRLVSGAGRVMKRFRIDGTFHELLIHTADLPKGVYMYQLKTDQGVISSGKLIHD
ncbi:MAG: T9SS type A sorting domain-containing protein [Bacteroidota bacterium]